MAYSIKEFKPCPFCGRIWMSVMDLPEGRFSTLCRCGAQGPSVDEREAAIEAWNTRDQHLLWNPFRLSIRFQEKTELSVDFKGTLASIDLATILQALASRNKTGILQVTKKGSKSVIVLRNGNIVAATDSEGARLGQILYKNGMISHQKLQEALAIAKSEEKMLGEVLLIHRFVGRETLREIVYQQVQEAVKDLFNWKEGDFEYRDCDVEFGEQGMTEINTIEIIMESLRRIEERFGGGPDIRAPRKKR